MRSLAILGLAALLAALAGPGCVKDSAKTSTANSTDAAMMTVAAHEAAAPAAAAEAEVKPAPEAAPPAAVAPAVAPVPAAPQARTPAPSALPEAQTKNTLEPKPARTAALAAPKSEPAPAPLPEPVSPPVPGPAEAASPAAKASPAQAAARKPGETPSPARSIAVVGDSLAVGIGLTMEKNIKKIDGMVCHPLGKVSTGLISKKGLDWEKKLTELVAREKPTAVVVVMGGNDANNSIAGKAAGTPEWNEAYRQKAESFLSIAANGGVKVLWVGLPAMRDAAYSKRVQAVNAAAREACSKVAGCAYMDASDIFVDASGNYVQAKDIGGKTVSLRAKDGVHMTMTGYDLLCRQVLDKLAGAGTLPPQ